MGWTYFEKGLESTTDWFKKELEWADENRSSKVLATAIVGRKEAYAAVEINYKDGRREVWAAVFLINYVPRAKDGMTFGYKDMSEEMGPVVNRCPKKILDLLTPTDNKHANDWRSRCRERLERRETSKLKPGDLIRFDYPLTFSGYGKRDTFRMEVHFGKTRFMAMNTETGHPSFLCKLSNWRERSFTKIMPEDVIKPKQTEPTEAPSGMGP